MTTAFGLAEDEAAAVPPNQLAADASIVGMTRVARCARLLARFARLLARFARLLARFARCVGLVNSKGWN
jgi:hypothetical protein